LFCARWGRAEQIRNVSSNSGVLPIKLGQARIQESEHTLVHYFKMKELEIEFQRINTQYFNLLRKIETINISQKDISNYIRIINFTRDSIKDKLTIINSHGVSYRYKRGLINGLGSLVKFISGNLDATDGEKYNKILEHLKENEFDLEKQISSQYSLSKQIISNFNETINNLKYNDVELRNKILKLNNIIINETQSTNLLAVKDSLIQLYILYNNILNVVQEIENSILFCKIGILHPSIITTSQLYLELKKIVPHYGKRFPLPLNKDNVLVFESLIKVHCHLKENEIIYFLSIPINSIVDYE